MPNLSDILFAHVATEGARRRGQREAEERKQEVAHRTDREDKQDKLELYRLAMEQRRLEQQASGDAEERRIRSENARLRQREFDQEIQGSAADAEYYRSRYPQLAGLSNSEAVRMGRQLAGAQIPLRPRRPGSTGGRRENPRVERSRRINQVGQQIDDTRQMLAGAMRQQSEEPPLMSVPARGHARSVERAAERQAARRVTGLQTRLDSLEGVRDSLSASQDAAPAPEGTRSLIPVDRVTYDEIVRMQGRSFAQRHYRVTQ